MMVSEKRYVAAKRHGLMGLSLVILVVVLVWTCEPPLAHALDEANDGKSAGPGTRLCPDTSEEWIVVPDTMDVPDDIVERVAIRQIVVCEHGVFFRFRAGRRSESRVWWIGLVPPTRDQYRYCYEGELQGTALELELTQVVAEATVRYAEFRGEVVELLGARYQEGETIRFDRTYGRKPTLEGVSLVTWRGKELDLGLIPNLYVHR